MNCDNNQWLCQQAGIRAYPTVRFYKGAPRTNQMQVMSRSYDHLTSLNLLMPFIYLIKLSFWMLKHSPRRQRKRYISSLFCHCYILLLLE